MLADYIKQINKKTAASPIFYITNNAERAIGVEELLRNFFIIDASGGYTARIARERGVRILSKPKHPATSLGLVKDPEIREYIDKQSHNTPYVQFFKTSKALEKAAYPYHILCASADIASHIENKVKQYTFLQEGGFGDILPKALLARISVVSYTQLSAELGNAFVIQSDIGHSGNATYFIHSAEEFDAFVKTFGKTHIMMKFTEKLTQEFLTIDAVATKKGTYIGGLCNQITGLTQLHAKDGETCGNNWYQIGVTPQIREETIRITQLIGDYLYKKGFRGYFGLDFALHNEKVFVLEINARQIASIQTYTKLQIEQNQIPLAIINLLELLDIDFTIDVDTYNRENNIPIDASVLIVRNHADKPIQLKESHNGMYSVDTFKFEEDAYHLGELYSKSKVIVLEADPDTEIGLHEEYIKILSLGNVMKDQITLDDNIMHIVKTLQQDIIT